MAAIYCFDIETLLNERQPESVLVMGDGADPALQNYLEHKRVLGRECHIHRVRRDELDDLHQRYDMGIVTETIEHLDKQQARLLLARLRDLYTRRFCVSVRIGEDWPATRSAWSRNEMLGLGLMLVNRYHDDNDRPIHLYKYDISTYKPTPGWLNPDDWANPELWNKYRW